MHGSYRQDQKGRKLLGFIDRRLFACRHRRCCRLHKTIEAYLFGPIPVAWALAVGGILMIAIEFFYEKNKSAIRTHNLDDVTYRQALFIGIAQVFSMWPGTSRSMITIVAALIVGLDMLAAAEFSFLLSASNIIGSDCNFSARKLGCSHTGRRH